MYRIHVCLVPRIYIQISNINVHDHHNQLRIAPACFILRIEAYNAKVSAEVSAQNPKSQPRIQSLSRSLNPF